MKKFIFRRPFITKKDRAIAKDLLLTSEKLMDDVHDEISAHNGVMTLRATVLIQNSCSYMNKAARRLGFRNVDSMNRYLEIHGKF